MLTRWSISLFMGAVLAFAVQTPAAFNTVGEYDPDNAPHNNQVDQSGVYASHEGNAGPENVLDLEVFKGLVAAAYVVDTGGVINIDEGGLEDETIIGEFGASRTKTVPFASTSGILHVGSSVKDGRRPTSGTHRLAKSNTGDFTFDIGPITGGPLGETITYVAGTLLDRDGTTLNPTVIATFSGGGTVTATAEMTGAAPSNDQDTFFGFVAPPGESIVNISFQPSGYTNLDDIGFITSSFHIAIPEASHPYPEADAVDVERGVTLSWTPGEFAVKHRVYIGQDEDAVTQASPSDPQGVLVDENYDPNYYVFTEPLDYGATYYWRIDEVNDLEPNSPWHGEVWSFAVEPYAYPVGPIAAMASSSHSPAMGPERTIDGSGLNNMDQHGTGSLDMWLTSPLDAEPWIQYDFDREYKLHELWVWNSNQAVEPFAGFGANEVSVAVSVDGSTWTPIENVDPFNQATGREDYTHNTTVALGGALARYVKLTIHSGFGLIPQRGLSEVRFFYVPTLARQPYPADGATLGDVDVTLKWRAGREAVTHEVSIDSDRQAVADGQISAQTTNEAQFIPATLNYGSAYYWQINEVNEAETPSAYAGPIWMFNTPEFLMIDTFESYEDKEFLEIWATWSDGYQDSDNGALVGNGNEGERTIVYEGGQSMPMAYDNSTAAFSEVTREFETSQDWTRGHPQVLSLQVRGHAPALGENVDGSIVVGAAGADIHGMSDDFRFVYKKLSGNGSIRVRVEGLVYTHEWAKAGPMIRESLSPESSMAAVFLTSGHGVQATVRSAGFTEALTDSDIATPEQTAIDGPVWLRVDRQGNTFNYAYALDEAGTQWVSMGHSGQDIYMIEDVFIGLAVTSHNVANSTAATFTGVATSGGGVSGAWTAAEVGGLHPGNDAVPFYLRLEDSSGRIQSMNHPDNSVSQSAIWQEWQIPLSAFSDLALDRIKKITIGAGQVGGAASGETGTLFFDALRIGTPMP